MGCASSSPFITSNGKEVLATAKGAASDAIHSGEGALNDVKDSLNEKVGHVKEAVIGAVQNVGNEIGNAFNSGKKEVQDIEKMGEEKIEKLTTSMKETDYKIIPLKDPNDKILEDALDELASTIGETTNDIKDETEKLTNDVIQNTENVVEKTVEQIDDEVSKVLPNSDTSDTHSLDSLKTTSPEPEIEQAMANDTTTNPPTPRPTYSELEKLQMIATAPDYTDEMMKNMPKDIMSSVVSVRKEITANEQKRQRPTPNYRIYRPRSNRLSNLPTKWEKRHDHLSKLKKMNDIIHRNSSISLFSGDSGEFKKPNTMYLVFGNNFLKTPKIKVIESQKESQWTKQIKQTSYELDLYTGTKTTSDVTPKRSTVVSSTKIESNYGAARIPNNLVPSSKRNFIQQAKPLPSPIRTRMNTDTYNRGINNFNNFENENQIDIMRKQKAASWLKNSEKENFQTKKVDEKQFFKRNEQKNNQKKPSPFANKLKVTGNLDKVKMTSAKSRNSSAKKILNIEKEESEVGETEEINKFFVDEDFNYDYDNNDFYKSDSDGYRSNFMKNSKSYFDFY